MTSIFFLCLQVDCRWGRAPSRATEDVRRPVSQAASHRGSRAPDSCARRRKQPPAVGPHHPQGPLRTRQDQRSRQTAGRVRGAQELVLLRRRSICRAGSGRMCSRWRSVALVAFWRTFESRDSLAERSTGWFNVWAQAEWLWWGSVDVTSSLSDSAWDVCQWVCSVKSSPWTKTSVCQLHETVFTIGILDLWALAKYYYSLMKCEAVVYFQKDILNQSWSENGRHP